MGEIYIRSNRFSNNDLVRKIEEQGGAVWLAPIGEWISYVNYTSKKKSKKKDNFIEALSNSILPITFRIKTSICWKKYSSPISNTAKNRT